MATPRFFFDASIEVDANLTVHNDVHHHLSRVLRLKPGNDIVLFNGKGGEYTSTIVSMLKRETCIHVNAYNPENREPGLAVHLGLCVLKKDAMDRAIARAVEVGVSSITPLVSDYCTVGKKILDKRIAHWNKITIASCEQCGLNLVPAVDEPEDLATWLCRATGTRIICHPGTSEINTDSKPLSGVSLLVGPEGGFSPNELAAASHAGFQRAAFGKRILRAETAPLVALASLHSLWKGY